MVAFNKQRVQYDDETKKIIYEEYTTTRKSMAEVAEKYNININTVVNIVKKYKAIKRKEDQFLRDNIKQTNTVKRPIETKRTVQEVRKPVQEVRNPPPEFRKQPEKPKTELSRSAKREKIIIDTKHHDDNIEEYGIHTTPVQETQVRMPNKLKKSNGTLKKERKISSRNEISNFLSAYQDILNPH